MEVSSAKLHRIVKVPKSYIWKRFEAFKEVGSILPPPIIDKVVGESNEVCLLYTSPSPRDATLSRMPSSA